jgi:hypothetical protein
MVEVMEVSRWEEGVVVGDDLADIGSQQDGDGLGLRAGLRQGGRQGGRTWREKLCSGNTATNVGQDQSE